MYHLLAMLHWTTGLDTPIGSFLEIIADIIIQFLVKGLDIAEVFGDDRTCIHLAITYSLPGGRLLFG